MDLHLQSSFQWMDLHPQSSFQWHAMTVAKTAHKWYDTTLFIGSPLSWWVYGPWKVEIRVKPLWPTHSQLKPHRGPPCKCPTPEALPLVINETGLYEWNYKNVISLCTGEGPEKWPTSWEGFCKRKFYLPRLLVIMCSKHPSMHHPFDTHSDSIVNEL
jgi:hypothetical protein